ncbi:MAG: SpoIIE family protein phosphatase [Oscillochloris sp.]|nr:SpoIIE family protein phosphatase [Oscillochloris sp.]
MTITERGRILVVDDNPNNRDLLSRRLTRRGHLVATAENGIQCLEMLRAQRFDLLVLDIMMPGMDGYEVLARIKPDERLRHIPVIVVSALDELDSVVRCIELGAEDYLVKPINSILLNAKIDFCLERKLLRDRERAFLAAVKQELELGRRTQADFLPARLPAVAGYELAAAFHPAREVAGDFYDAFTLPDGRLGLLLGDVCDKGVGAALFMALTRSLLRAFADEPQPDAAGPLHAVSVTNTYIARHHRQSHMYATLFFGALDQTSGRLSYVNAGHPPAVLLRRDGTQLLLDPTGPAAGLMPESSFAVAEVTLYPGETLLIYTDGATEARDGHGELFGEERVLAVLREPAPNAAALMERIERAARAHAGDGILVDDVTMLSIRRLS